MARWCPACGRPKEEHQLDKGDALSVIMQILRPGTMKFQAPRRRICNLRVRNAPGEPGIKPIYTAIPKRTRVRVRS